MRSPASLHMTPEEFRRHGHALIDWIADYRAARRDAAGAVAVAARRGAGAAARRSRRSDGEPFAAMMADVERVILPGPHPLAVAELLRLLPRPTPPSPRSSATSSPSGLGVQGMLWATSPACTELETHVLDWLAGMLDLPANVPLHRPRRRRDPGHGEQLGALRAARRARARHRRPQPTTTAATAPSSPTPRPRPTPRWRRRCASPASAAATCA